MLGSMPIIHLLLANGLHLALVSVASLNANKIKTTFCERGVMKLVLFSLTALVVRGRQTVNHKTLALFLVVLNSRHLKKGMVISFAYLFTGGVLLIADSMTVPLYRPWVYMKSFFCKQK